MQEAWLLFDENAIRSASGNPNGKVKLNLPKPKDTEKIPDPKAMLFALIRRASELNARRLRRLSFSHCRRLVAEYIGDFSPLREMTAFAGLGTDLQQTVAPGGWPILPFAEPSWEVGAPPFPLFEGWVRRCLRPYSSATRSSTDSSVPSVAKSGSQSGTRARRHRKFFSPCHRHRRPQPANLILRSERTRRLCLSSCPGQQSGRHPETPPKLLCFVGTPETSRRG